MKRSLVWTLAAAGAVALGTTYLACEKGGDTGDTCEATSSCTIVTSAHGDLHKYVVNSLQVPMSRSDFAIDLNGDGHVDNQLGNIIGALSAQNFDVQTQVDDSVKAGRVILLISVQTTDTSLKSDTNVGVTFYLGKEFTNGGDGGVNPDFTGTGMFTVDS